jgi:hypothetical protein
MNRTVRMIFIVFTCVIFLQNLPAWSQEEKSEIEWTGRLKDGTVITENDLKKILKEHQKLHEIYEKMLKASKEGKSELSGADLQHAYFTWADLSGADLSKANLKHVEAIDVRLTGAYLREANLQDACIGGSNLTGADLTGANLTRANLQHAKLVQAKMQFSILTNANLDFAALRQANVQFANLSEAKLSSADLRGADLYPIPPGFSSWFVNTQVHFGTAAPICAYPYAALVGNNSHLK